MTPRTGALALFVALGTMAASGTLLRGDGPPAKASADTQLKTDGPSPADVRAVLAGLRGTGPVACEMALRTVGNWYGSFGELTPDRDSAASRIADVVWQRITSPPAVAVVLEFIADADPCTRRLAARLAGRSGSPQARDRLLALLGDQDPMARQLAATGLGYWRNEVRIQAPLVRALQDRDPSVRAAAAWALGSIQ